MTLDIRCLIEQDRKKSSPSVELCVGTMARPARYMWSSLSTCTQRTGTLSTGRTSTMNLETDRAVPRAARRSLCSRVFRVRPKTSSSVEKVRVYAIDVSARRPLTGFRAVWQRYPRLTISSATSAASRRSVTQNWTAPLTVTVPSVSSSPASSARRCDSDARRYSLGMCLLPSTPIVRSRACRVPTALRHSWQSLQSARRSAAPRAQVGAGTGSETNRARPPHDRPHVRT